MKFWLIYCSEKCEEDKFAFYFLCGDDLSKSGVSGGSYNLEIRNSIDAVVVGTIPPYFNYTKYV
jgi:hypothetical protein